MRLLNVSTFQLSSFLNDIPDYAILSHTWAGEEVSYQQLVDGSGRTKKGWNKIERCCKYAAENGFDWCWVDTCCIDKTNSVELSEAINSMFRWYENAVVCYAYLEDVILDDIFHWEQCRWFRRGWTLQELLAPRFVVFLDHNWTYLGTKASRIREISGLTGISVSHLRDFRLCDNIATKMTWAGQRQTTRVEDEAYCLLG